MRRWIVFVVVVGVLGAAVVYLRSRPLDVHVRDIESLVIDPYPEGPPGPRFLRGLREHTHLDFSFDSIDRFIPDPLPNTGWQGLNCGMGGNLIVTLRDGDTITYGPCRRPDSINQLWAHMLDIANDGACRPRCGPGGLPGP